MLPFLKFASGIITTISSTISVVNDTSQHIFFRDEEGDIWEWCLNKEIWSCCNVTQVTKLPKSFSSPVAVCTSSGGEYLYFYTKDNQIYRLSREKPNTMHQNKIFFGKWKAFNITENLSTQFEIEGDLVCLTSVHKEYIFFRSKDGQIYLISNKNSGWRTKNLTQHCFSPRAAVLSDQTDDDFIMIDDIEFVQYPSYPLIRAPSESDLQNLDELQEQLSQILLQEKSLKDQISREDFDGDNPRARELLAGLEVRSATLRNQIRKKLKNQGLYPGNICGNFGLGGASEFLFYLGYDGKLNCLRHGLGFLEVEKTSHELIEAPNPEFIHHSNQKAIQYMTTVVSEASKNIRSLVEKSSSALDSSKFKWSKTNLFGYIEDDLIILGNPVSHCTNLGSLHVFFIDYPNYHIHEFCWYPSEKKWEHHNLTQITLSPPASPFQGLQTFASGRFHYVFYTDKQGTIYQLSQSISTGSFSSWQHLDLTSKIPNLPKISQLCHVGYYPTSTDFDSIVLYFLDRDGKLISLDSCYSKKYQWEYTNLSDKSHLKTSGSPFGKISAYNRDFLSAFSSQTYQSLNSLYSYFNKFTPWASLPTEQLEEDESKDIQNQLTQQMNKIREDAIRLREQKEVNEKLASELVLQQQEYEKKTREEQIWKEKEVNRLKQELEEKEKQMREFEQKHVMEVEEWAKKAKEEAERVRRITGGYSFEDYIKVQQAKEKEIEDECSICMDAPPELTFHPCKHKILCLKCYNELKQSKCPFCSAEIQSFSRD